MEMSRDEYPLVVIRWLGWTLRGGEEMDGLGVIVVYERDV